MARAVACNGYLMLFGAVLVGIWVVYFCSRAETWRRAPGIVVAWAIASLPLVPVMWTYREVLQHHGLRRSLVQLAGFSTPARAFVEASDTLWFWGERLPGPADKLFPGVVAPALVALGLAAAAVRGGVVRRPASWLRTVLFAAVLLAAILGVASLVSLALVGPWRGSLAGIRVSVSNIHEALAASAVGAAGLLVFSPRVRTALALRSAFVFYVIAIAVFAVLSLGPVLKLNGTILLEPLPYRLLMYLPWFDQLRVPPRFWMLGTLCLAAAAGLAFVRLPLPRGLRPAAGGVIAIGLLIDGWALGMDMGPPARERPISRAPWSRIRSWSSRAGTRRTRGRRSAPSGIAAVSSTASAATIRTITRRSRPRSRRAIRAFSRPSPRWGPSTS